MEGDGFFIVFQALCKHFAHSLIFCLQASAQLGSDLVDSLALEPMRTYCR